MSVSEKVNINAHTHATYHKYNIRKILQSSIYFCSKEQLIVVCIQRIINNAILCFSPDKKDYSAKDGLEDRGGIEIRKNN